MLSNESISTPLFPLTFLESFAARLATAGGREGVIFRRLAAAAEVTGKRRPRSRPRPLRSLVAGLPR